MIRFAHIYLLLALLLWPGALPAQEGIITFGPAPENARTRLTIHGSTDIAPFTPILKAFARRNPDIALSYEQHATNDIYRAAAAACRAETATTAGETGDRGRRRADLLVSSSIDQQVKLANDGCARRHRSGATAALPDWANWRDEVFGLTREPAVMVYNRELVPEADIPRSRFDLLRLLRTPGNRYTGKVATYDIERSGLGYLFAFADSQHATTFGRLIEAFGRNNAVATCCSAEIIDQVADGRYLIAYNLLGSYALLRAGTDPRIGISAPEDYTLLLSRAALIPANAGNPRGAGAFIDFALGPEGRAALAEGHLLVDFGDGPGANRIRAATSGLRPITLSPVLLVGLDAQRKAHFLDLWRSSVPPYAP